MKCGARVALGVAGGYFLGRTKKVKLALMLAGMVAGRRAGGPGELLAQGQKLISGSPELTRLTDEVRGRLIDAGKQAAVAVAARQVEALTDRVTQRAASLGDVAGGRRGASEESDGSAPTEAGAEDVTGEATDLVDTESDSEQEPEPEPEQDGGMDAEAPAESSPAPRRSGGGGNRSRAGGATGTARRATGTATRAAGKSTGRATRSTRTRRSDDG